VHFGDCKDGFGIEQTKVTSQNQLHFVVNTEYAAKIIVCLLNLVLGNAHLEVEFGLDAASFEPYANIFCNFPVYTIICIIITVKKW
jgi:hypothetical protein